MKFKKHPRHGEHLYSTRGQGQGNDKTRKILTKKAPKLSSFYILKGKRRNHQTMLFYNMP